LRRHTNENEYYVRFPSTDGKRIVYSNGATISFYDIAADAVSPVEVHTHSTAPQTVRRFENAAESLEGFAPHPDGTQLAFVSRGQQFTMPLFNTELFTNHIESAFEAMYERYRKGLPPDHIYLPLTRCSCTRCR